MNATLTKLSLIRAVRCGAPLGSGIGTNPSAFVLYARLIIRKISDTIRSDINENNGVSNKSATTRGQAPLRSVERSRTAWT